MIAGVGPSGKLCGPLAVAPGLLGLDRHSGGEGEARPADGAFPGLSRVIFVPAVDTLAGRW